MDKPFNPNNHSLYFTFNCFACKESFNIHLQNLKTKKQINCPNCNSAFPEESLNYLKESLIHLEKALIVLNDQNKYNQGWNLSLFWHEDNAIPEKPDIYPSFTLNKKEFSPFINDYYDNY